VIQKHGEMAAKYFNGVLFEIVYNTYSIKSGYFSSQKKLNTLNFYLKERSELQNGIKI